jgi:RHS repeat-associated protein
MTRMPHLPVMQWTFLDQLQASSKQVVSDGMPETTYYVYDAAGQRVRKVTERKAAADSTPTRKDERLYLGGFEIYREYAGDSAEITLERETLHVMDDNQRVALVETRTRGADGSPVQLTRYQLGNHLGSASLELDDRARIISYEEYSPYGSTSYQAVDAAIKAAAKRYRYAGMERDEETGLTYHGARYSAVWLGRWTASDPSGLSDGLNLYRFNRDNPIRFVDPNGRGALDQMQNVAYGVGGAVGSKVQSAYQGAATLASNVYHDPAGTAITMAKESLPGKVLTGNFSGAWNDVKEMGATTLANAGNLAKYSVGIGQAEYSHTLRTGSQQEIQAATEKLIDDTAGMIDTGSDILSFGTKAVAKILLKKSLISGTVAGAAVAAVVPTPTKPPIQVVPGNNQMMIKPVGTVEGRPVVLVQQGEELQLAARRTGGGGKSPGAQPGDWESFEGFLDQDLPLDDPSNLGELPSGWFNKSRSASTGSKGVLSGFNAFGEAIPPHLDRWGSEAARSRSDVLKSYEDVLFGYESDLHNIANVEKAFRLMPDIPYQQARRTVTDMGYTQPVNTTSELLDAMNRSK